MSDTFEVKNDDIAAKMKEIGGRIHAAINESELKGKMGFALCIFEFAEKGAFFYMSDAQRADMIRVLQEFVDRQRRELELEKL